MSNRKRGRESDSNEQADQVITMINALPRDVRNDVLDHIRDNLARGHYGQGRRRRRSSRKRKRKRSLRKSRKRSRRRITRRSAPSKYGSRRRKK